MGRTGYFILATTIALTTASCSMTTVAQPSAKKAVKTTKAAPKKDGEDAAEKLKKDITNAEMELKLAKMELEEKELSMADFKRSQKLKLSQASMSLNWAKKNKAFFEKAGKAQKVRQRELNLQSSKNYMDDQKDQLDQLEDMYKEDEFAKDTKELVLMRGRRNHKIAVERYEMAQKSFKKFMETDLPKEEENLRNAVDSKEDSLKSAEVKMKTGLSSRERGLIRAKKKVKDAKEKLEKLKKKQAKASA